MGTSRIFLAWYSCLGVGNPLVGYDLLVFEDGLVACWPVCIQSGVLWGRGHCGPFYFTQISISNWLPKSSLCTIHELPFPSFPCSDVDFSCWVLYLPPSSLYWVSDTPCQPSFCRAAFLACLGLDTCSPAWAVTLWFGLLHTPLPPRCGPFL